MLCFLYTNCFNTWYRSGKWWLEGLVSWAADIMYSFGRADGAKIMAAWTTPMFSQLYAVGIHWVSNICHKVCKILHILKYRNMEIAPAINLFYFFFKLKSQSKYFMSTKHSVVHLVVFCSPSNVAWKWRTENRRIKMYMSQMCELLAFSD